MLPWIGGLAPTPSHKSPVLVDIVARPRRTCPGFCRAKPGCSGMLPWMDGLARPRRTCPGFCIAKPGCLGIAVDGWSGPKQKNIPSLRQEELCPLSLILVLVVVHHSRHSLLHCSFPLHPLRPLCRPYPPYPPYPPIPLPPPPHPQDFQHSSTRHHCHTRMARIMCIKLNLTLNVFNWLLKRRYKLVY
jgi:hypothetical protein